MAIEKILLANSANGQAQAMLKALMEIPYIQRAKVTVLQAIPPQTSSAKMALKQEEGNQAISTIIQNLNLDPDRVSIILREGDPKDLVCKVAQETDTDLIIVSSRALKRLQAILENSVSQYVFQLSDRPMLLVKDDVYVKKITRIMVAVDGSPASQNCLDLAIQFLRDIKGGELILAHVKRQSAGKGDTFVEKPEQDPILSGAIAQAKKQGIAYRCATAIGKPGVEICRLADEWNVGLLIIGSPDRRPSVAKTLPDLDRLIGSSISDYVRVNINCPVLLARTISKTTR
ncbi:universal stress protein [Merismopedia glauca]|uniref:Universal stress protein n=1 Tax=Merismopedia glauca CCAP 1448/3 TaxID=1296344 RepID=A0A2T1C2X0_9CYAN|nr:universal stress protein [Merismopedia glauca]PSB02463.1 universal stress protein [Merismopedia glauca CCAP 1448/3]